MHTYGAVMRRDLARGMKEGDGLRYILHIQCNEMQCDRKDYICVEFSGSRLKLHRISTMLLNSIVTILTAIRQYIFIYTDTECAICE